MQTVHATTVALGEAGVLIRGPSGSGKSDLALRLVDGGGLLVADDRTALVAEGGILVARPPSVIAGRMEVRGLGVVRVPFRPLVRLRLIVDLVPADAKAAPERMPTAIRAELCGVALPCLRLRASEASAAAKIRLAVRLDPADIE